jgi:hypothetical protein
LALLERVNVMQENETMNAMAGLLLVSFVGGLVAGAMHHVEITAWFWRLVR